MTERQLRKQIETVRATDKSYTEIAQKRWNHIAKPLHGLGLLEEAVVKLAAIQESGHIDISRKALVIMCADNGIVEEGVTQTGQQITAVVTENATWGRTSACLMAKRVEADVIPVDIGVAKVLSHCGSVNPLWNRKLVSGTGNFLRGPAMSRSLAAEAVGCGIQIAKELNGKGYGLIALGEMGIGNTTTSSAVASVLLDVSPETVTGRGAGLSDEGLSRKINVIKRGIALHRPDRKDVLGVLSAVGGLDLAGLAGLCLGGALFHIPIVLDGVITGTAALAAAGLCPAVTDYLLASHAPAEPAGTMILEKLGLKAPINAGFCLGEGTGAMAYFPMLDMAVEVYEKMSTFSDIGMEEYQEYSKSFEG